MAHRKGESVLPGSRCGRSVVVPPDRVRSLGPGAEVLQDHSGAQGDMLIRDIIARMRHDGCGGAAEQNIGQATAVDLVSIANQATPGLVGDTGTAPRR
jgi:hypothetical protein